MLRAMHEHLASSLILYKNGVVDDAVPAILQYRSSDLYLTDRKETMAISQKDTHTLIRLRRIYNF